MRTLEYGTWPTAVAAFEANTRSEGTAIHVVVADSHGDVLPCGAYTLALDDVVADALTIGSCDAPTAATPIRVSTPRRAFRTRRRSSTAARCGYQRRGRHAGRREREGGDGRWK